MGAATALTVLCSTFANAVTAEPPQSLIMSFYDKLLGVMKDAKTLGFDGRYKRLEPVIGQIYNLPLMTRVAVGAQWTQMPPEQQRRLIDSFTRYTVATYASRFSGYDGERFEVSPTASQSATGDTIVETRVVPKEGDEVSLNYLMRNSDGGWKVVDIFLSGTISELATRRSEFTSVLRRDGADGLAALLDKRIREMSEN